MPLDVSVEAIEADLAMAERGGTPGQVALALARAQVRATLLAAQPADHQGRHEAERSPTGTVWTESSDIRVEDHVVGKVFLVPSGAAWDDRVTAAAMLLNLEEGPLRGLLRAAFGPDGIRATVDAPTEEDARAGEPEEDIDADFFAEAKKARRKK